MMEEKSTVNPLGVQPIGALMRKFSIPAIISMLVNALYNIVDQIFIGQSIGMLGIAATNVVFPLVTICTALGLLMGIGGASNFNLMMGRKEPEAAGHVAGVSISLLALTGLAVGVLSFVFANPLLLFFGATEQIMPYAGPYMRIIALGAPFAIFSTGASHLIRADGSPNYAMTCMLSGAIFNVVFDPIFLFVFNMGIEGIAWATTLGQILTTIIALYYFRNRVKSVRLVKALFRPNMEYVKRICSLGMAACFNQMAMTVVQITLNTSLRYYGAQSQYGSEIPLACVGALSKVNIVFMAFTIGLAQGCQPIIGFNYGARQYDRVKSTYKRAAALATLISVFAFLIFQLLPTPLLKLFDPAGSPAYFEFGTRYLRIYMLLTFVNGIQPVTTNFFTSIGKARLGLFMSLTRQIIFLLPLILILPYFFGMDGIMYAGPVSDAAAAIYAAMFAYRELKRMPHGPEEVLQN